MKSRLPLLVAAGVAGLGVLLSPCAAKADPVSDAKDLFEHGRELREHGDCAGAVGMFRKAYELYPAGLGSMRNLAECEESLGHYASARRSWLDLKRALLIARDRKYDGWDKDADDGAARLAPKVATLTIDVKATGPGGEAATAHDLDVTLDGEPLAASLLNSGTPLDRDPGRHVVHVGGGNAQAPVEQTVDVVAGDARRVTLAVVVTPEPAAASSAPFPATHPMPTDDEAERARATRRLIGWSAIGVGGVSLVLAAVSLGLRQSALSTINGPCPTYHGCDPSLKPTDSQGQTASAIFSVTGLVGLVAVGGGVALLLTSASPHPASAVVVTPSLGGASAAWRF